jgi:hypothetical protein
MTKREIASLAIKLMGVFILLKSIVYIPMSYSGVFYAFQGHTKPGLLNTLFMIMMSTGIALIPVAFSIFIILFSNKAAEWLIKEDAPLEQPHTPVSKGEIMSIAISCLGLYFIIAAVPQVISGLLNGFSVINRQTATWFTGPYRLMNVCRQMIAPAVQMGLGVWLFLGSKGIIKIWKKFRS